MVAYADAHVFRNAIITADATDYTNQLRVARLVPETPEQVYRTLVPDGVVVDVDSTVWTFEAEGLQSWKTGGLAKFLNDNAGTQVDLVLQPVAGTGQATATFTITAKPMPFGGEQGQFLTSDSMEFTVVGEPTFGESV